MSGLLAYCLSSLSVHWMEPGAGRDVTSTLSSGWEHVEAASTLSFFPPYTGRLKNTLFLLRPGVTKTIPNGQAHDKNLVSGVGLRGSQGGSKFFSYFQLIFPAMTLHSWFANLNPKQRRPSWSSLQEGSCGHEMAPTCRRMLTCPRVTPSLSAGMCPYTGVPH